MVFLKFHAEFHMDGLQWGIRTWMMRTDDCTREGLGGFGGFLKKWGPLHKWQPCTRCRPSFEKPSVAMLPCDVIMEL